MTIASKRDLFKFTLGSIAGVSVAACGGGHAAPGLKPAFVLVHGAWEGAWVFERLVPLLGMHGHAVAARDLPGHGLNAGFPASYQQRPLNPAAFGTEPSPVGGATLDAYVASVVATIDQLRQVGYSKVILVGHSLSGTLLNAIGERYPEKISELVYLAGFMPKSGVPAMTYMSAPENQGEMIAAQLQADPAQVGALRVDYRSEDAAYRAMGKAARYAGLADADYAAVASLLSCDEPVMPLLTPVVTTAARWGALPRNYIKTGQDRAVMPALQQRFIAEADALTRMNPTRVHQLNTDHTPHLSQPVALATLLMQIAST